jgi:hypothetical protein
VRNDAAVVIEHRHLSLRIDRHEPVRVLLELVQIDLDALKRQTLLDERNHRLQRVRRGLRVIILESHEALPWHGISYALHTIGAAFGQAASRTTHDAVLRMPHPSGKLSTHQQDDWRRQ